jgi:hypothetical protein
MCAKGGKGFEYEVAFFLFAIKDNSVCAAITSSFLCFYHINYLSFFRMLFFRVTREEERLNYMQNRAHHQQWNCFCCCFFFLKVRSVHISHTTEGKRKDYDEIIER